MSTLRVLQTSQIAGPVKAMLFGMLAPYPDGTGADIDVFPVTGIRFKESFGTGKLKAAM